MFFRCCGCRTCSREIDDAPIGAAIDHDIATELPRTRSTVTIARRRKAQLIQSERSSTFMMRSNKERAVSCNA